MKIGVSGPGLQDFADQTRKAVHLSGFSQIRILIKFVEFRRDYGRCLVSFS